MELAIAVFVLALGATYIVVGRVTGKEYPFGFGWLSVPHARRTSGLVVLLATISVAVFLLVAYNAL